MSDEILWTEIGNIYLKFGSPRDAIAAFAKAVELNPKSAWGYCSLGNAYLLTEEFGHALFMFRKSLQLMETPGNQAVIWNKIGDAYRALKDIENAIQAYKKADALDMGTSPIEPREESKPEGLAKLSEIVESESKDSENIPQESGLVDPSEPIDESVEPQTMGDNVQSMVEEKITGEPISNTDPTDTKPVFLSRHVLDDEQIEFSPKDVTQQITSQNTKENENQSGSKEKPLIVIPTQNETLENIKKEGLAHSESQQIKTPAPALVDRKNSEGRTKGHPNIGLGTDDLEEILAKVNIYENITRVNPTSDRGWDTLGKLYKTLGRYKDAIGAYEKAIEVAPDKEVYYYYLGLLFSVEQQNEEAIQAFQFVLRKNPDYVLAHSALAGVYHRMGLENKANHHISIALPKMNNESTYNRACFYVICGDHELAFEFLTLALANKETTIDWIKSDPDLDPIRADQRYLNLISEDDQIVSEHGKENYFSSELEGKHNKMLPILNHSLTR